MLSFLLIHWKIVVPGLLILALGIDDGVQRITVANLHTSQAQEIAAAEAAVRKALAADQELSNRLVAEYAAQIAALQGNLANALVLQAKAPSTPQCDHSPAAAVFDRSVRALSAGPAQSKPAR